MAEALAETGDIDRSRQVVRQAEAIARSITDSSGQVELLVPVARAMARAGDVDRAKAIAGSVTFESGRDCVLAGVAEALARAGEVDQAEAITGSITVSIRYERGRWGLWRRRWPGRVT